MKKYLIVLPLIMGLASPAMAGDIALDSADPMFLNMGGDFLVNGGLGLGNNTVRLNGAMSYGISDRFTVSIDSKYQEEVNNHEDGWSGINIGGIYRSGDRTGWMTDVFGGINIGGSKRILGYSDIVYHAGVRVGRQWDWVTLAGTAKSSWIFDEAHGMAWINLMPETYFRILDTWSLGVGADFRKSTMPSFDEEFINAKVIKRYGHTQYVFGFSYGFEQHEWTSGLTVNVLF